MDRIINSSSVPPEQCIFCKIIRGELSSYTLLSDDRFIAFLDTFPFREGHTLVCPKKHGETVWDMSQEEIGGLFMFASKVSKALVIATDADGFRLVQNNGEAANQVVPHVHVHVIPVKLSDKGRWLDRKKIPPEEMSIIKNRIIQAIS